MPHIGNFPAPGYPKPLSIHPSAFMPSYDTYAWRYTDSTLRNNAVLTAQYFYAPVYLPQGARVTKLTLFGYREDILADLILQLFRVTAVGTQTEMAVVIADWEADFSSKYDDTIVNPVVDNENYSYMLKVEINPNDADSDVMLSKAQIDWQ